MRSLHLCHGRVVEYADGADECTEILASAPLNIAGLTLCKVSLLLGDVALRHPSSLSFLLWSAATNDLVDAAKTVCFVGALCCIRNPACSRVCPVICVHSGLTREHEVHQSTVVLLFDEDSGTASTRAPTGAEQTMDRLGDFFCALWMRSGMFASTRSKIWNGPLAVMHLGFGRVHVNKLISLSFRLHSPKHFARCPWQV